MNQWTHNSPHLFSMAVIYKVALHVCLSYVWINIISKENVK